MSVPPATIRALPPYSLSTFTTSSREAALVILILESFAESPFYCNLCPSNTVSKSAGFFIDLRRPVALKMALAMAALTPSGGWFPDGFGSIGSLPDPGFHILMFILERPWRWEECSCQNSFVFCPAFRLPRPLSPQSPGSMTMPP